MPKWTDYNAARLWYALAFIWFLAAVFRNWETDQVAALAVLVILLRIDLLEKAGRIRGRL